MNKISKTKIILVSNIGSMSRKYFVYSLNKDKKEIKEIFNICFDKKDFHPEVENLDEAILKFFEIAKRDFNFSISDIDIIAERVVAAGEYFLEHKIIDEEYLKELNFAKKYDLLHSQSLIKEIEKLKLIKEVAKKSKIKTKFKIFGISDSEFHKTISPENYTYGIKNNLENHKINLRKYGYHGISMNEVVRNIKKGKSKIIAIHLGGGGSVTAIENGKSIWNSFGMTPVSGIVNMTRVGDIDPFVILETVDKNKKYFSLLDEDNYQFEKTKKEIYEESGLLALTGEKDMRDILNNLKSKDKNKKCKAIFGIEVYLNRIIEKVGSAYALLGGCDELMLTGSILEKSEVIRKKLLEKLKFLELQKDFSEENIKIIKTEEEVEMVRVLSEKFFV